MKTIARALAPAMAVAALLGAPVAHAEGDPDTLEAAVGEAYAIKQAGCTPDEESEFDGVVWDAPPTGDGGAGTVLDENEALGGQFTAAWDTGAGPVEPGEYRVPDGDSGYWDITFWFC